MALRKFFGTDGVRGIANTDLSPSLALAIGAAAAQVLTSHAAEGEREVVVGRDPRLSGDLLESAIIAGLCSQGVNVAAIGVIPTPGVAYETQRRKALAGIVISASHNPMADNGIKFFGPDGYKLADAVEAEIEAAMDGWEAKPRPEGAGVGRVSRDHEPVDDYAAHLVASAGGVRLDGLKLVIDGANGAASFLAGEVFSSLGAEVTLLFCSPDGVNINAGCGSLHPEKLLETVRDFGADAGLAFDGDADRVILADNKGRLFDGDRMLCACGIYLKSQGRLTGNVVIGTVMSNLGLEQALERNGIRLVRASVGDRYVSEQMAKHGAVLGGEKSGHILFPELSPAGDGMLTAIQVLRLCRESGRTMAEWADEMSELPQKLVNIMVRERDGWEKVPAISSAIEDAEAKLAGRGRLLVRPSGTEKMIRVMAEGPDATEVDEVVEAVANAIRADRGL